MKKFMAMLLAVCMLCGVLAGCGGTNEVATTTADGEYTPTSELAIELWYTQGSDFTPGADLAENVVADWLYEKTKVKVESIYGNDGGQWDTKLSRLVAGDNMPAIVACGAGQGPAHFAKLAESDLIYEITDEMLEKYAPNYLKRVPKERLDMFRIDGKLYGLPYHQSSSVETNPTMDEETLQNVDTYIRGISRDEHFVLYIRDDILKMIYPDAHSFEEIYEVASKGEPCADMCFDIPITTKEEYIDFMYKIKDLGLTTDGGDPVYAFGYSGGDNWEALNLIGGDMMGFSPQYYTSAWRDDSQEIVLPLVEDVCYQAALEENRMLRDKVFDPESLVNTPEIYSEKILNGQYAIFGTDYITGGVEGVNAQLEQAGKDYRYRPFNVNIPNLPEYQPGKTASLWTKALCFTKVNTEEELIQLLNWINVSSSDEFDEIYWWGPKEAGLYTEENGVRKYVDDRFNQRFIDGKVAALDNKETKGIGVEAVECGAWYVNPVNQKQTAFAPQIYNKTFSLPAYTAMTKVTADSPHAVTKLFPQSYVWAACYADIPEVVEFWAKREKWENAFKIAFTATSDEDFDKKWQEAKDTLGTIVDVNVMTEKMTEVARQEVASMGTK